MATNLEAVLAPYNAAIEQTNNDYNNGVRKLESSLNLSNNKLMQTNEDALRQAYLASRRSQNALPQAMAAQGLNGGATETSMVRLNNNYMNNRAKANAALAEGQANLAQQYANDLGDLENTKLNALADLNAKIAAAKANAAAAAARGGKVTTKVADDGWGTYGSRNTTNLLQLIANGSAYTGPSTGKYQGTTSVYSGSGIGTPVSKTKYVR